MYWLHPPSLLRRAAAIALLVGAVAWDLRSDGREPYPVALTTVPAGSVIPPEAIGWVDLPRGALPLVAPQGRRAAVDLAAGDPLVPAVLADGVVAPDGWWTIPIAIGTLAAPGDETLLVVADPPFSTIGLVLESQVGDSFAFDHRPAAVAVPADVAPAVAAAERAGLLVVAVRPASAGQ